MRKLPGVHHLHAIRVFEKAGFQGKHTIMSNGARTLIIPRHNPINAFTMGQIARAAGLTPEQFRKLL